MKIKRRPIVAAFLGLVSGVILAGWLNIRSIPLWSLGGIAGSVAFLLLAPTNRRVETGVALVGLAFLGVAIYGSSYFSPETVRVLPGNLDRISGKVASYPKTTGSGTELTLKPDNYPRKVKVFLTEEPERKVDYGDELTVSGDFQLPTSFQGFDYREYLRKREVWAVAYDAEAISVSSGRGNWVMELGWKLRKGISSRIYDLLPDQGGFLVALIFGERDALRKEVREAFTETGLAHLLAASGLHLGLILAVSWWILIRLGFEKGGIYLLSLPVLLLYLAAVGFKLPLLRASLIYLFGGAHFFLERSGLILSDWYDRYQALATAALLLTLYHPEGITTVGFQLSFGATFAIALFIDPFRRALPLKPNYLSGILAASLAAQLGVGPALAVHFGRIHPWAPVANLLAVPAVTAALYLGLPLLVLGRLPTIGPGLIRLEAWIIERFKWLIAGLSEVPLTSVPVPTVTAAGLFSYFVLVFWLKWHLSRNRTDPGDQLAESRSLKGK